MVARLHGLRKAFCVYWAQKAVSTHQIAAMAGHLTPKEVERYTRAADRLKMVKLLVGEASNGTGQPSNGTRFRKGLIFLPFLAKIREVVSRTGFEPVTR
jgi:hypothetical protein